MDRKDPLKIPAAISSLNATLRTEIKKEQDRHRNLYASGARGRITQVVLGAAILVNILVFLSNPVYPLLFISASFFLFMIYFITLLIPHNLKQAPIPPTEISAYLTGLQETGIVTSTLRFTRVFLNAFFMNCRTLFYGFALIFAIVIALVIQMSLSGVLTASHTYIILFESAAIILFYFLVWRLEPYTLEFFSGVTGMKDKLIRKKIPASIVSSLFIAGAALALSGIIITIILLPGMTFNNILSVAEFKELSNFFLAIAVIIVTLYFIIRYIHGITSRDLLERFTKNKTECLSRQMEITGSASCGTGQGSETELSVLRHAAELLIETQIYQVDKKTLFGTFPVYVINPDFSWVFATPVPEDDDTLE